MTLRLTNSLTGEQEAFEPRESGAVSLYFCGLTVSDHPHLGHARSWVHVDVLRRWLEYTGYEVRHVENFTDVNEKIVARIGEDEYGEDEAAVAEYFISEVLADMRSLNLKRAAVYPRVSEHIEEIIELTADLLDQGYAYEANGSVYFDVQSFSEYGTLSNQDLESIEAQGDPEEQSEKRHPADFALWKAGAVSPATIAEHRHDGLDPIESPHGQTWESPWSEGRPGWHIECSAMSMTHLDETFDIHVAGQDILFPHNENEIAQSEAASGEQFARFWVHVRMLETDGEKMSSSLQNFFTIRNAVSSFGPNPVRMFLLSTSYSRPQSYTEEALHEAVERWDRLQRTYARLTDAADSPDAVSTEPDEGLRTAVTETRAAISTALNDDLNTREALRELLDLGTEINRHIDTYKTYDYPGLQSAIEVLDDYGRDVLGFDFEADRSDRRIDELIELVLDIRSAEREAGNYDRADELRESLEELGIMVEDNETGTRYQY